MRIEAGGTLTVNDYTKLSQSYMLRKMWWAVFPLGFAVLNAILVHSEGGEEIDLWTRLGPTTIFVALIVVGLFWVPRYSAKKQLGPRAITGESVQFVFDESGIDSSLVAANAHIGWERVEQIEEIESTFYIYVNRVSAYIVPKRFFESPEQIQSWRVLAGAYVPANKWHKRWFARWF